MRIRINYDEHELCGGTFKLLLRVGIRVTIGAKARVPFGVRVRVKVRVGLGLVLGLVQELHDGVTVERFFYSLPHSPRVMIS